MGYRWVAKKIINLLYKTIDDKQYYDVILYGLEITISTLVNMILVVTLGFVLRVPMETLIFCLFFMPLRIFSGGAHAKSHSACIGGFLFCELGAIYISKQVSDTMVQYALIFTLLVVSCFICVAYAAKSKKASEEVKRKHRSISLVIIVVDLMLTTIGTLLGNVLLPYSLIAALAVFCQSVALLPLWSRPKPEPESKGERV